MVQVTVSINGFNYTVGCEDGQEEHLQAMARIVEDHIELIRQIGGQSGEGRLLALASLIMADKLYDMNRQIQELKKHENKKELESLKDENSQLKEKIKLFSDRAEALAKKLEMA